VITPHPLEAARMLSLTSAEVQADRLAAADALSRRHGCVALLKGSGTVVTAPGSVPFINPTGNASLASAGTGDVLAGWLAGLWSQCRLEATHHSGILAAVAAAYAHGLAAERPARGPIRAADLIEEMHAARTNEGFTPPMEPRLP